MASFDHPLIPIDSPAATLETSGGKGANLARLTRAGLPVPRGMILTTSAYRDFVSANCLADVIDAAVTGLRADQPDALEQASKAIRAAFSAAKIDPKLASSLLAACAELFPGFPEAPLAVRSSATTEDLPDLSFAGQQDTYLNIIGEDQLLTAVVNCWSSLWTARAIGYRLRSGIDQTSPALAVIIQELVPSEVSGVLFTANPLTGLLSESVIDATFGLGEALVSGQVEPDHFVVDSLKGSIVSKSLGAKRTATRARAGGGVISSSELSSSAQSLSDEAILQLVAVGQKIEAEYGTPQDIEWAMAGGRLYILQSRPITSLFPIPEVNFSSLKVWFSFGAVQGLIGPVTPLGRDAIRYIISGAARIFGVKREPTESDLFVSAGERTWVKISDLMRNPIGSRLYKGGLKVIEPSVGQILQSIADDPGFGEGNGRLKFNTLRRMAGFVIRLIPRVIHNMTQPEKARQELDAAVDRVLAAATIEPAADPFDQLANILTFLRKNMIGVFRIIMPRFAPIFGPSLAALSVLRKYSGDDPSLPLRVTRSLPNNVTVQMDLALWETARTIQSDPEAARFFDQTSAEELARAYLDSTLPTAAQAAVGRFMEAYGMRGIGEIDFGLPRWREEPAPVMHTLKCYLQIDPFFAPDLVFTRGEQAALEAVEIIAANARGQKGGKIKEMRVRQAARRVRALMGARESPKFLAIRIMGIARKALLNAGQEFAKAGIVHQAEDLFFLTMEELDAFARKDPRDWKSLIASRRAVYEREQRRRQVPRVLVSDGRAFYEGLGAEVGNGTVITGSPVSPGMVEGNVHIIFDPRNAQLLPGEILVCPGTDPAWTPLFMAAGGLITEVGGMMTHGSVVAREYGIPAVVGVHEATLRLKDGMRVRVDGTEGKIIILEPANSN